MSIRETSPVSAVMPPTYSTGWIYVLKNESMPRLLKIGFTKGTLEQRIKELSSHTGVPSAFTCVFRCGVRNPEKIEKAEHEILAPYRSNKEFFMVEFGIAVDSIRRAATILREEIYDEWEHSQYTKGNTNVLSSRRPFSYPTHSHATAELCVTPKFTPRDCERKIVPGQLTAEVVKKGNASISLQ